MWSELGGRDDAERGPELGAAPRTGESGNRMSYKPNKRSMEVSEALHTFRARGQDVSAQWQRDADEYVAGLIDSREFGRRVAADQPLRTIVLHGTGFDPIKPTVLRSAGCTLRVTETGIDWVQDTQSHDLQDRQLATHEDFLTMWSLAPHHPLLASGDDAGSQLLWVFPNGQWPALYLHTYPHEAPPGPPGDDREPGRHVPQLVVHQPVPTTLVAVRRTVCDTCIAGGGFRGNLDQTHARG